MTPFDALADEPRWLVWREEPRSGKPTKVPLSAHGGPGKSDDPASWATKAEAETAARRLLNGAAGGIGIVLGDLGADLHFAGIDLDTCLDGQGGCAGRAATIIETVGSYAETSPSGTGIKVYFYIASPDVRPLLDRLEVAPHAWGCRRGVPGEASGNHGPAVEVYCSHRYFAVTGRQWGAVDRLTTLDSDVLDRLARLIPTPRRSSGTSSTSDKTHGGDGSRSAKAFGEGARLRREGKSYDEMCAALRQHADPEIREWVREKGDPFGGRGLKRIWERAIGDEGSLPHIIVRAGERHKAADAGIAALSAAGTAFYQRDRTLVRVCTVPARNASGAIISVPGIAPVTPAILDRALGQTARWERFDPKKKMLVAIDPPRLVGSQIMDMAGEWPFPPLAGVIGCPTLRADGSLLDAEGYDLATGLVLIAAVAIPPLSPYPTRSDAEAAIARLGELLTEFPFADAAAKAVALSMLMSPVLRGSMSVAPMHLTTAPHPGSGKSYLADVASMIATGEQAAVIAVAPNPEETEKRLIGSALAGHPVISLDNCRDTLAGDFLCQVTERPLLQLRALGKSDKIRVANTFTTFANGNNVTVADDLVRRTITCTLDANVEDPEGRTFRGDPLAAAHQARGDYIAACLTVARAYIAAGRPDRLAPLLSYEGWSDNVRSPLVWLGCADPVETMAAARRADPTRQDRARAFLAWRDGLGIDVAYTVPELIERAGDRRSCDGSLIRPALYDILIEVAQKRAAPAGQIEPRRLGRWLIKQENTIAAGLKLTVDRSDYSRVRYRLQAVPS